MAETVKDEKLKNLQNELQSVKAKKERLRKNPNFYRYNYNVKHNTQYWSDLDLQEEFNREIDCIQRKIDLHKAWKELNPIMSIMGSLKAQIHFSDANDLFNYNLQKRGNLFYLDFSLNHYTEHRGSNHKYNSLKGYIIYDKEGHVYLSDYRIDNDHCLCGNFDNCQGVKSYYAIPDPITIIDDEYIYVTKGHENSKIFHLTNGKFELVHSFDDSIHAIGVIPELWANGLLIIGSKLFNAYDDKFELQCNAGTIITPNDSSFIYSLEKIYKKEVYEPLEKDIDKFRKENHLLLITDSFRGHYEGSENIFSTICFTNMKGKIVSILCVISHDDGKCREYKVTNDNYNKTIKKLQEEASNELKQRKNKRILNQKEFCELMQAICNGEEKPINPTLNLNPNNKN